jgi:hypothetical protein
MLPHLFFLLPLLSLFTNSFHRDQLFSRHCNAQRPGAKLIIYAAKVNIVCYRILPSMKDYRQVESIGNFRELASMLAYIPFRQFPDNLKSRSRLYLRVTYGRGNTLREDNEDFWIQAIGKDIVSVIGDQQSGKPIDFFAEATRYDPNLRTPQQIIDSRIFWRSN